MSLPVRMALFQFVSFCGIIDLLKDSDWMQSLQVRKGKTMLSRTTLLKVACVALPSLVVLVAFLFTNHVLINASPAQLVRMSVVSAQSTPLFQPSEPLPPFFHGKTHALSWIFGRDCQQGVAAYMQTASREPDA